MNRVPRPLRDGPLRESPFREGLFEGRVAIVTGGGSGIGFSTASEFAQLGARVAIAGRNEEKLRAAAESLRANGGEVFAHPCDIREPAQIATFLDALEHAFGGVDILVNNAGGQFPTTAETVSPRGFEAVVRNNLNGTFFMTQAVATRFLIPQKRGRIVNVIANIARGFPGMVHTGAARAGVENMTKTLAVEWARHNVQTNAVAPGVIESTGTVQYPPEMLEFLRTRTPQKRYGRVEEVAHLIVYLACDAAHYVTGETWYIDGGAHLWGDTWQIDE